MSFLMPQSRPARLKDFRIPDPWAGSNPASRARRLIAPR
jgi:hypothetical protein